MKRRYILEVETELGTQEAATAIRKSININPDAPIKVVNCKLLLLTTLENLDITTEDIDLDPEDRSFTIEPSNEARR